MKINKIFIIQLIIYCLFTTILSAQSIQLQTPTHGPFYGMHFLDGNTGYIVGDSMRILKTTDGGSNWLVQFSGTPSQSFEDVHFINYNTGFVIQYYNRVYKTTNGGNNWDNVFNANTQLTSICFPSADTGYISGMNYAITLKTTNSGLNWFEMPAPNAYSFNIYFLNNITGYLGCTMDLFKTTNGGLNWTQSMNGLYLWNAIWFISANTGFAAIDSLPPHHGKVYKTTDAGANWLEVLGTQVSLRDICFTDSLNGYVISSFSNNIYKTTDGGLNWNTQPFNGIALYCIQFIGKDTGYVAGLGCYKTTNGGVTATINISEEIPFSFSLSQNYPNPFNPVTKIKFSIPPSRGVRGVTNLTLYDVLGREIAALVNEQLSPGTYEVEWDGSNYPGGIYFYKLITNNYSETKKMVLLK